VVVARVTSGRPFEGVRLLEVAAWTFVPGAGAVMADLGADVIKVEPPNGDPQRGLMNALRSESGATANPFVEIPNRGKRSITLDLGTEAGRGVLLELAATSDIFLTSYLPAVRSKLRIDLEDVRAVNPRIIYACGHGWGQRGPMVNTGGFDLASAWASASMAFKMTRPGSNPMFQPAAFFDLQGSNTIAGAIGTALYQRERTGEATEIDVSLLSVGMWSLSPDVMAGPFIGGLPHPDRRRAPNPITNDYPTADGRWLYLVCLQSDRYWDELCTVIGRPDLAADERFVDMVARATNAEACVAELEKTFVAETLDVWRERLRTFSGVWAPCLTPAEVHEHAAVLANGYLPEVTTNDGSTFRLPSPPAQYGGVPSAPQGPAPELGQHTEELLLELGHDWDHIGELRAGGALG
jgi:formyl-CoA transferase